MGKYIKGNWKTTPYPQDQNRGYYIHCEGINIAEVCGDSDFTDDKANAEFIVRACNNHYDLLEACKEALKSIDDTIARYPLEKTSRPDVAASLRQAITKVEKEV